MTKLGAAVRIEKEKCRLQVVCAALKLIYELRDKEERCWSLLKLSRTTILNIYTNIFIYKFIYITYIIYMYYIYNVIYMIYRIYIYKS